jgi:MFS family permease
VGETRALPEPSLRYRWIKANVYGALLFAVVGLIMIAVSRMLAVNDPDTTIATTIVFLVAGSMLSAYALGLWGRLTGAVLSRKLPVLPMRTWIALHAFMGLAVGLFVSTVLTIPEVDPEPVEFAAGAVLVIVTTVFGMIVGALAGVLQGLVLRKAARSVRAWIGYSMLAAGLVSGLGVLAVILGPETATASDLFDIMLTFIAGLVIATLLLPAVRRLQPREAPSPAPDTSL